MKQDNLGELLSNTRTIFLKYLTLLLLRNNLQITSALINQYQICSQNNHMINKFNKTPNVAVSFDNLIGSD